MTTIEDLKIKAESIIPQTPLEILKRILELDNRSIMGIPDDPAMVGYRQALIWVLYGI